MIAYSAILNNNHLYLITDPGMLSSQFNFELLLWFPQVIEFSILGIM